MILSFMIFFVIYQNTSGPCTWIYAQETLTDTALGVVYQVLWGTSLIMALIAEPVVDSRVTEAGSFFALSVFAFIFGYFMCSRVKETFGLTEKAKKELYCHRLFAKTWQEEEGGYWQDALPQE